MHDELLRLPTAAEAIGHGETTTRRLIREGRLRAVLVDGVLRVPRSAIDEFIASLPEAHPGADLT